MACQKGRLRPFSLVMPQDSELLRIESLGSRVGGVARPEGLPVTFVRGALPGELVRCGITSLHGSFRIAGLVEIVEPSPERTAPFCPMFGTCGGCTLQHLAYASQLEWKRRWVESALRKTGARPVAVLASPLSKGYRNRVSFDVVGGRTGLHMHAGDPVPVDDCPLLNDHGRRIHRVLSGHDLSFCRRVSVRAPSSGGAGMVEFRGGMPHDALVRALSGCTSAWEDADGVWRVVSGTGAMVETIAGVRHSIRPGCFFQVNSEAAGLLAGLVAEAVAGCGRVLDLFGGSGLLALSAASAGASVTSVEWNADASAAGRAAAAENGFERLDFVTSGAREFLARRGSPDASWDAVICDPPRSGAGTRVSRLVSRLGAPKLVWVGCDPWTTARDLITLSSWYDVEKVVPLDMFPQTDHVETVVMMSRRGRGGGRA